MYTKLLFLTLTLVLSLASCSFRRTEAREERMLNVPDYPTARNSQLTQTDGEVVLTFETPDTAKDVRKFYATELPKGGWTLDFSIADQLIFLFPAEQEGDQEVGRSLLVRTFPSDSETQTRVELHDSGYTITRYDQ